MADNSVTLAGNLTKTPVLKATKSGIPRTTMLMAVSRKWNYQGEEREETNYFRVIAYDHMAEHCADNFQTGDRIIVVGRIDHRRYDNEDGTKNDVYEIVANDVGLSVKFNSIA